MTDDKLDNEKNAHEHGLGQDDMDLWSRVTRDVKPLKGRIHPEACPEPQPSKSMTLSQVPKQLTAQPVKLSAKTQARDVDRNTMTRLKEGKTPIDGVIDLHGFNQGQARQQLIQFIRSAHASGYRCVRVITGKGNTGRTSEDWLEREPGVLKRKVPDWLYEPELGSLVLQAVPAQPKHGGDGALYVLLRRKRDYTNSPAPGG